MYLNAVIVVSILSPSVVSISDRLATDLGLQHGEPSEQLLTAMSERPLRLPIFPAVFDVRRDHRYGH